MKISLPEARFLILKSQGLLNTPDSLDATAVLAIISHLGYIQIDTLAVVARAHHHTLWSRTSEYQEKHLDQLFKEKKVFEYWSHAASILPMSDYRFSLPLKAIYAKGKSHWFSQDKKVKAQVLTRIKNEGPLQAKDFLCPDEYSGQWYAWKPAKQALEQLVMEGKLMVSERQHFRKVYDLTERVLPSQVDITLPSEKEYAEYQVLKSLSANGIMKSSEISYMKAHIKKGINNTLKHLLKEDLITEIHIEGLDDIYFGIKNNCELLLNERQNEIKSPPVLQMLSPFDNSVIQRKRLQTLFNFHYVIECYLPLKKRQYGYFSLPILYGDRFVARFDPKVDRKKKIFYVQQFHLEPDWKPSDEFAAAFVKKLKSFALFNNCEEIQFSNDVPRIIKKYLEK